MTIIEKMHRSYYRRTGKVLITPVERILMAIM